MTDLLTRCTSLDSWLPVLVATLEEVLGPGQIHAAVKRMPLNLATCLYFFLQWHFQGSTASALQACIGLPARPLPDLVRHRVLQPAFEVCCMLAQVKQAKPCNMSRASGLADPKLAAHDSHAWLMCNLMHELMSCMTLLDFLKLSTFGCQQSVLLHGIKRSSHEQRWHFRMILAFLVSAR